ncbi:COP9 signalosome complex subunit 7 like [Actinidia chinensis var. chinensis]|uniref:COP9 signalosome complex subunit 7 like n=1 Tax=Actinidia chinensis var. chinensis TaxID=1590841 RepID=A0A2R6RCW3_ACTCC|nr:COP9 signalosome complex subunit 7 like [Actinidia chinensis var. chinensis]
MTLLSLTSSSKPLRIPLSSPFRRFLPFPTFSRLTTSDNLLISIHEKIKWADTMSELDKKHKKEVEERVEEVKKSHSVKKLHTVSRPTWTSEATRRSIRNLVG